jgi:hypothetical protein
MFSYGRHASKMAKTWGGFRIASEVGKALGDPTEGVVTGLTTVGAVKGVNAMINKKGKKWSFNKLAPIIGKSLAKRVVGGAAAAAWSGPGAVVAGAAGIGYTIYDIYNILKEEE